MKNVPFSKMTLADNGHMSSSFPYSKLLYDTLCKIFCNIQDICVKYVHIFCNRPYQLKRRIFVRGKGVGRVGEGFLAD